MELLRIPVFFDEERYIEGENLTREEFYEKLAVSERLPKTAQITPVEFEEAFRPYVEAGEEIVVLPLAKELSGTYQSACIAKEQFPRRSSRWWTPGRSPLVWRFWSGRRRLCGTPGTPGRKSLNKSPFGGSGAAVRRYRRFEISPAWRPPILRRRGARHPAGD